MRWANLIHAYTHAYMQLSWKRCRDKLGAAQMLESQSGQEQSSPPHLPGLQREGSSEEAKGSSYLGGILPADLVVASNGDGFEGGPAPLREPSSLHVTVWGCSTVAPPVLNHQRLD